MRRAGVLLVLMFAVGLAAQHYIHIGSRSSRLTRLLAKQTQAERVLTLLDFWSQTLIPNILLEQSRARAVQVGDVATATRVGREVRRGLQQAERFPAAVAHDPALRNRDSLDVRALRAAAVAWADWASALLRQPLLPGRNEAPYLAELETKAIRLHQAAYEAVDGLLGAALLRR